MKFTKEFLQDIADLDHDPQLVEINKDEIIENTRWSEIHEVVFKTNGKFYASEYSTGLTEQQSEDPYEYDGDMIECIEVEPKEITVIEYVKVES